VTSDRADKNDLYVLKKPEDHVADFTVAVGAANESRTVEDKSCILEVDMTFTQIALALRGIPVECADTREWSFQGFVDHHSHLRGP